MIKNERQYRITRAEADKFQKAVDVLAAQPGTSGLHPELRRAEIAGLQSQLDDLRAELAEYDTLKSGKRPVLQINSLEELPRALVQARIAAGISQKELADRLGLKEQQIQRYEANDYASASITRLARVCKALRINVREEVFLPTRTHTSRRVFARLKEVGIDKEFVLRRLLPRSVAEQASTTTPTNASDLVFHATTAASRIYGWTPTAILGSATLGLDQDILGAARFKVSPRAEERRLSAFTIYAHFLALQLLEATTGLPTRSIPTDAQVVRRAILAEHGALTLANALRYVWNLGVPVLPLRDPGAFHGACWRVNGRNVIVLKQSTLASSRWLSDLLHELRHTGSKPQARELAVIESPETSPERLRSDEEVTATQFAADVLLDSRAETLVKMCVDATRQGGGSGRIQLLTAVLPMIAKREGVPVDALANYMAFRLSLQGENWWGAAMNLQNTDDDPWLVARDILLLSTNLARLTGSDRELLTLALTHPER